MDYPIHFRLLRYPGVAGGLITGPFRDKGDRPQYARHGPWPRFRPWSKPIT